MDKLRIDEIIAQIDSKDRKKREAAIQSVESSISDNEKVLHLLVEQYYILFSDNVMQVIINLANEKRAQSLYDSLQNEYNKVPHENLRPTLTLLANLLARHDHEPTWMYLIVDHHLFNTIIDSLLSSEKFDSMPAGLVFMSMLLPIAHVWLEKHLEDLLCILTCSLDAYHGLESWDYMQRICFHYLVTLYSIYPRRFLAWTETLPQTSHAHHFVMEKGRMLKLHGALLQPPGNVSSPMLCPHHDENALTERESHDIIWEVSCYTETLDLLYEAQMVAGVQDGEVTEIHDISWESTDSSSRSIGCQTADLPLKSRNPKYSETISDGLINTYLDKTLMASFGPTQKRKNSHRFEHDSSENSQLAVMVLEGELMLERYLRFQHERRNRRYLSQVRQCYDKRSQSEFYKEEYERLKHLLSNAENKVAELTSRCEEERWDSQQQLFLISEKLNKEMGIMKKSNNELMRNEKIYTEKEEGLLKKLEGMSRELSDLQSVKGILSEKQKQLDVSTEHNYTLTNKVKQLQNQVFVVNEIRSYQCEAINALKPFTYKSGTKEAWETTELLNLKKLAAQTGRKFEISENELKRLRSTSGRMEEEIVTLKEKLAKQKTLTEKTTDFWEQKYSGLEKTCETYKHTYSELSQKVLKLKRDLELRPY